MQVPHFQEDASPLNSKSKDCTESDEWLVFYDAQQQWLDGELIIPSEGCGERPLALSGSIFHFEVNLKKPQVGSVVVFVYSSFLFSIDNTWFFYLGISLSPPLFSYTSVTLFPTSKPVWS